ncbi:MAG: SDR family oxidoreductase [Actinobacteria bacterium]|nr:SDR family oxidoreductase [Actinomycetota bacterium]
MATLREAHVIITGGSEGIGRAMASSAIRRGATVSLIARRPDRLEAAAAGLGPSVRWAVADVADRDALTRAVDDLVARSGPCDVMIANAGYSLPGRFWELPASEFRAEMDVNYLGAVNAVAAVLPAMRRRRRGHLCFVSSTAGLLGVYGFSAYSPTKFALRGLAESLRSELVADDIAVSVLYPPDTDTPGFARENEVKPAETAAISGTIRPKPPRHVAEKALAGIERDRFTICADPMTAALARGAGLLAPVIRWTMDRQVRAAQRT